jgi:hypothetical protein
MAKLTLTERRQVEAALRRIESQLEPSEPITNRILPAIDDIRRVLGTQSDVHPI